VHTSVQVQHRPALAIRRELRDYQEKKPGKVPPADSPSRPGLARLWAEAHSRQTKQPNLKTFTYQGSRYGLIYIGTALCVLCLQSRMVLVRPPTSMPDLRGILGICW
jgi:hypothetical protein